LLSSSLSQIRPELVYASPANQKTKGQNTERCMSVSQSVLIAISYSPSTIDDGCFFFLKHLQAPATISLQSDRCWPFFFFFFLEHPPPTIYTRVLRSEDL
jgi:hypothetical protein